MVACHCREFTGRELAACAGAGPFDRVRVLGIAWQQWVFHVFAGRPSKTFACVATPEVAHRQIGSSII